jgi:antitoxin CcdA
MDKTYPSRPAGYDLRAPKQTVSVTINSDLYAQAKGLGINTSQVAEAALAREVATRKAQRVKEEIRQDLEALDAYEAKHGSFAQMVRDHYQSADDDEAS